MHPWTPDGLRIQHSPDISRPSVDLIHWPVEAVFVVACYAWFTFCCFFVARYYEDPGTGTPSESLDHYLRRIWLPQSYVANYLLPRISTSSSSLNQPNSAGLALNTNTQRIHFLSNDSVTEAVHEQPNAVLVTTNPLIPLDKSKIIRSVSFTLVLRSPRSRLLANSSFQGRNQQKSTSTAWRSSENGVYSAGGWCWDVTVLLEGCKVAAMRVADDLGVPVPWDGTEKWPLLYGIVDVC